MAFDPSRIQYGVDQPFQPMPVPIHPGIEAQKQTARNTAAMAAQVAGLQRELEQVRQEVAELRSEKEKAGENAKSASRKTDKRWWFTTLLAVVSLAFSVLSHFGII